jgi:hypothetical protein
MNSPGCLRLAWACPLHRVGRDSSVANPQLAVLPQFVVHPESLVSLRHRAPRSPRHGVLPELPLHRGEDPLRQRPPHPVALEVGPRPISQPPILPGRPSTGPASLRRAVPTIRLHVPMELDSGLCARLLQRGEHPHRVVRPVPVELPDPMPSLSRPSRAGPRPRTPSALSPRHGRRARSTSSVGRPPDRHDQVLARLRLRGPVAEDPVLPAFEVLGPVPSDASSRSVYFGSFTAGVRSCRRCRRVV